MAKVIHLRDVSEDIQKCMRLYAAWNDMGLNEAYVHLIENALYRTEAIRFLGRAQDEKRAKETSA